MLTWEGISAESFIFGSDHILDLTDEELEQGVRKSTFINKKSTVMI